MVRILISTVFLVFCLSGEILQCAPWQENLRPKVSGYLGLDNIYRFAGNDTYQDYFKLVVIDGNSLLVGGRNIMYNLTIPDLNQNQILEWYSEQNAINMCIMKGKDEVNCQNYIRILARSSTGKLLLCGTNSFKPLCREYGVQEGVYTKLLEKNGQAICPYDPKHNSTFIYVDNELYSGTVTDFAGTCPIIYREPLQTEQYDSMSLNAPNFVNSLTHGNYVYFFFRETAVEYMNCGKAVYSRVARTCKHDKGGGPQRFRNRWTSFLKSRLNCSVHGDFPFYFNEIQSTSDWVDGKYGSLSSQLIYAVFTTPVNSITGSAVCAFSLQDISDTFEGNFKEQRELNSNWLPVSPTKVPDPRPGQCVNDSKTLPDTSLNFIKEHSLMDEAVIMYFKQPVLVSSSTGYKYTNIAVDPQVTTVNGRKYDVLFIGTDNGKLIKAINSASADSYEISSPVIIEELQLFSANVSITNLKVVKVPNSRHDGRLIVVSDEEILSLALHRCNNDQITSCSKCVSLQDPYCVWDKIIGKCRALSHADRSDETYFYQSITTGLHSACPLSEIEKQAINVGGLSSNLNGVPGSNSGNFRGDQSGGNSVGTEIAVAQYSVETLLFGIICGTGLALVTGFGIGYICGRKCRKDDDDNIPYPDTEYEYFEQRQNVNISRLAEPKLLPQEEVTYAEPVLTQCMNPLNNSPKTTSLKKQDHLFSPFQNDENYYPAATSNDCITRTRDHFGTLRSQRNFNRNDTTGASSLGYRGDGYNTTRSVKKVYL